MTTERKRLDVGGLSVDLVRKDVKNLHVGVYPPSGRVRVAAPLHVDDDAVRVAVVSRMSWIRRQQRGFEAQVRQSEREVVSGESHDFLGQRYLLDVVEGGRPGRIERLNNRTLRLTAPTGADRDQREAILQRWYRRELRALIPPLVEKWEPRVGKQVAEVRIKRMKTRWGSCNADAARIWLNLELVKKPPRCLEYVLVHEMVHLHERRHNDRFRELLESLMPNWRLHRDELNHAPLAHEDWEY